MYIYIYIYIYDLCQFRLCQPHYALTYSYHKGCLSTCASVSLAFTKSDVFSRLGFSSSYKFQNILIPPILYYLCLLFA